MKIFSVFKFCIYHALIKSLFRYSFGYSFIKGYVSEVASGKSWSHLYFLCFLLLFLQCLYTDYDHVTDIQMNNDPNEYPISKTNVQYANEYPNKYQNECPISSSNFLLWSLIQHLLPCNLYSSHQLSSFPWCTGKTFLFWGHRWWRMYCESPKFFIIPVQ